MDSSNIILNLLEDISSCWNPERFSIARYPQYVGTLINKSAFLSKKVSCLDMLIKKPFSNIRLPYSDRSIIEIVDICLEYEKNINPNWNHYYTYLTIDQRLVKPGFTHRREGIHFDGMQGVAYRKKMPVCHSYIVFDTLPTRFYTHKFMAIHLSEARNNWFFELEQQAKKEIVFCPNPFDIFLMTAYQIHEAVPAINFTTRTFVRVEFTLKKYNRIGNTVNPLLGIDWQFVDREIPVHLRKKQFKDTGWKK
ncbi:hypothetical protein H6F98_18030 [Microcoleus sp. FACHB-SPT15]|uniref:hypothetical protein n=1 Tax=Microcoleus sp. FACHB-SPT15 TaxID=2692830 RepID=UPI00177CE27E|nr:hypothetical protein [Microcoleus sp. FACHB-SPT15]MBD1807333.1 hypothetical protein [Microcoleus sp. FACHB-SPT15]